MLYFVATPIGNLEDITNRAKKILSEADLILAEDTRRTRILLSHLKINKTAISFHEHSNISKLNWIIDQLKNCKISVAYVSDAGTPNLSDPGGKLVEAAFKVGIEISPIPGPSALTALICVAPFSCSQFQFLGYFPKKKGREKMAAYIKNQNMPVFFYESPYRIYKTLEFLAARLANHHILIGRELTKKFEQIIFTPLEKAASSLSLTGFTNLQDKKTFETIPAKGEFVFAIVKRNT